MKFTVIVNAHPESLAARSALLFCKTVIASGHTLYRIFFYGEGVVNGAAREQSALNQAWADLVGENQIDAVCCVGSATTRGLGSEANLTDGFTIAGLGQMIDGLVYSDRVMTFGKRVALA